jgi:cell division protein YceG involved in septum cleavage
MSAWCNPLIHNKIAKVFLWSKDKLKLESIFSKINKVFEIKYGIENNDFINNIKNIEIISNNNSDITLKKIIRGSDEIKKGTFKLKILNNRQHF